ncbi:MAG: HD domain-containing phosphohydrolase [Candidatus Brocadiia bacterium]
MVRFQDIFKKMRPVEPEIKPAEAPKPQDKPASTDNRDKKAGPVSYHTNQALFKSNLSKLQEKSADPMISALPEAANPRLVRSGDEEKKPSPFRSAPVPKEPTVDFPFSQKVQPQPAKPEVSNTPFSRAAQESIGQRTEPARPTPVQLSSVIKAQDLQETEKAVELYEKLASLSQAVLDMVAKKSSLRELDLPEFTGVIKESVNLISRGDRSMLDLIYRTSSGNYLIAHQVNTAILAMEIGKGIGYSEDKLEDLGLSGLLHDVGMQEVYPMIDRKDKLSSQEYEQVKNHITTGANLLKGIPGLADVVWEVCQQHHERITGSGYKGLSGKSINEYAHIIALADTFEAITHSRPYRRKKSGQEAVKDLIETSGNDFDRQALKVLVKRVGIYPVGTWVEMNTGEIARVVRINETFPLRPTVVLMYLADGSPVAEPRSIELAKNQMISIKSTLDEGELARRQIKEV